VNRRCTFVDVFGARAFAGNPVAVIHDAAGLDEAATLAATRWFDLSETTFLMDATTTEADYRVRIFTPAGELPFAGHPTLGSCRAWLQAGGRPRRVGEMVQECGAGLVRVRVDAGDGLAFSAPPLHRSGPVDEATIAELAGVLRVPRAAIVDAAWADNGPRWVALLVADAEAVLALEPAREHGRPVFVGAVGTYASPGGPAYEVRAFFSDQHGLLREDPVTGSLNGSAAQWMLATRRVTAPFTVSQGQRLGRDGRVRIDVDGDGTVWVGGSARVIVDGALVG
jgi:PhzF family phenazine biosynthesis protein